MNKPLELPAGHDDRVPYQKPQPWGMVPDMVVPDAVTDDERLWAPLGPGMWSRPLQLNVSGGFYVHLLKVKRSGLLQRHRHSGAVHAYVIRGRWHYLEHDWVAEQGSYIFEPPGETHTLVVPDDCTDMITLFTVILLAFSNAESFTPCFVAILLSESLRFTTYTAPAGAAAFASGVVFAGVFAAGVFVGAFAAGAVAFAGTNSVSPG